MAKKSKPKPKKTPAKDEKRIQAYAELPPALDIRKIGRPSKYQAFYCELVLDLGAQGKSKAQIAAAIGVTRTTMDTWAKGHPEFLDALKTAKELELSWWENAGQLNMTRQGFNATAYIFQMKNRFRSDYRDVQALEHQGRDGGAIEVASTPIDRIDVARRLFHLLGQAVAEKAKPNGAANGATNQG